MVNYKTVLLLVVALVFGCLSSSAFSQEVCENGVCQRRPLPEMVGQVVTAPVRVVAVPVQAVTKVIQNRPVRRLVASRPLRRVFGIFRCR